MEIRDQEQAKMLLQNCSGYIRWQATIWIGINGDINLLTPMLRDRDSTVRYKATRWIGARGDVSLLESMLQDDKIEIKDIAQHWLKQREQELIDNYEPTIPLFTIE